MDWAMRSARSGSVAASASAMPASALAFEDSSVMDWAMRSARSGSVAASAPAMSASALAFESSSGDGLGDAFRAVRVGGCQCPRDVGERAGLSRVSSVMDWAMRSASAMSRAARSGSVAASAPAMAASALAFEPSSGDGLGDAFRAVRVGGRQCARDVGERSCLQDLSVMDWAMRSASAMSRAARSGSFRRGNAGACRGGLRRSPSRRAGAAGGC